MRVPFLVASAVITCAALSACAGPGPSADEQPHTFIKGTTVDQVQNALVAREMTRGWSVVEQGANVVKLEHPWNNMNFARVMFNALNGARSSVEDATFQLAQVNGGVEVVASSVIVSDLGFGNRQTTPMRNGDALQQVLDDLQVQLTH